MKVGKCRMQYMHDTLNRKIKASQGVEYINCGHNYTVAIKNALSIQTVNFKYSTFISNNNTIYSYTHVHHTNLKLYLDAYCKPNTITMKQE